MKTRILFKDAFSVIGKVGQGSAANAPTWISPIWNEAAPKFNEILHVIKRHDNGDAVGVWGAMNDIDEQNKRWNDTGKYMAGCEANVDAIAPNGWTKWIVPAQTYLVADCTMDTYGEIFGGICCSPNINIVGTVHERYPQPCNPSIIELYFPIASGMLICQSCSMPMSKPEDFGTEMDGCPNKDYCCHCYGRGAFFKEETMEQMIESCIPFCIDEYKSAEAARADMMKNFPKLKRWAK